MSCIGKYRGFANDEFRGTVWMAARKIAMDVRNEATTAEFHHLRLRLTRPSRRSARRSS